MLHVVKLIRFKNGVYILVEVSFCSKLDLLDIVLPFSISILKICISHQNYRPRVKDITSFFEKQVEYSSGHILSFCPILFKNRVYRNLSPGPVQ